MTAGPGHFRETKTGYFIPRPAGNRALISDAMNQAVSGRAAALGSLPGYGISAVAGIFRSTTSRATAESLRLRSRA